MYRWFRALCFVTAAVLGAVLLLTVPLLAQGGNLLSGGPLWWLPDNEPDWPRHHDRWLLSPVEVAAEGAATSFPMRVWEYSRESGEYIDTAPPNSACDLMNGTEIMSVGPPDPDRRGNDRFEWFTTRRSPVGDPPGRDEIFGGFQLSMHVGEYWQGRMFRQHMNRPWSRTWHRAQYPGWTANRYGSFNLSAINGSGTWSDNVFQPGMGNSIGFPGLASGFHLFGGGGATLGCGAWSLARMHGVENDPSGTFPGVPTDVNGSPCYSTPMIFVLRGNSEARCEPDLRERYPLTDRFYDLFDVVEEQRVYPELIDLYGDVRFPEFPEEFYEEFFPHAIGRRTEFALYTVAETMEADPNAVGSLEPTYDVWDPLYPDGPSADAVERRDALERFVDPMTRSRPFGGEPLRFRDYTGAATADTAIEDCLEVAPAGWYVDGADPDTYSFDPLCESVTSPYTGFVNHEVEPNSPDFDPANRPLRTPEVGMRDGRDVQTRGDTPLIRRFPTPSWSTNPDFGWFEHTKSTLGCLTMMWDRWTIYFYRPTLYATDYVDRALEIYEAAIVPPCVFQDPTACENFKLDNLELMEELLAQAMTLRVLAEYRLEVSEEMHLALLNAGSRAPHTSMRFYGKDWPSLANRRCYTGPIGQPTFNATVAPVGHVFGEPLRHFRGQPMMGSDGNSAELTPVASMRTFYGADLVEGRTVHAGAGGLGRYGFDAIESRGSASVAARAAAIARTGVAEPYPLDLQHDYSATTVVRDSPYSYRTFSCPTGDTGAYGVGLRSLGPSTLDHRVSGDPQRAWIDSDVEIDTSDPERRFGSGTPCIPDDDVHETADGEPLRDYYNVHDGDAALPGTERCYSSTWHDDHQAYLADHGSTGSYANSESGDPMGGRHILEYSGDGPAATRQPSREDNFGPVSYIVLPYDVGYRLPGHPLSEYLALHANGRLTGVASGIPSFDLERNDIWDGYGSAPRMRLESQEAYAGVAPGFFAGPGPKDMSQAPADRAHISYDGPIRFFGAVEIGASGGCTVTPIAPEAPMRETAYDILRSVMDPEQRVVCMLPVNSHLVKPTGACPNPTLFP